MAAALYFALFLPRAAPFFVDLDGGARQAASAKATARASASSGSDPLQLPSDNLFLGSQSPQRAVSA